MIARLPEYNYPWRSLVTKLRQRIRVDHGKGYDISMIDGLGGHPPPANRSAGWAEAEELPGAGNLPALEAAFGGDLHRYKEFWLYAWDDSTHSFDLVRRPALSADAAPAEKRPITRR